MTATTNTVANATKEALLKSTRAQLVEIIESLRKDKKTVNEDLKKKVDSLMRDCELLQAKYEDSQSCVKALQKKIKGYQEAMFEAQDEVAKYALEADEVNNANRVWKFLFYVATIISLLLCLILIFT